MIIVETPHTGPYNVWSASSKQDFIKKALHDQQRFADYLYDKNITWDHSLCENCMFELVKDYLFSDSYSSDIYMTFKELIDDYKFERRRDLLGTATRAWTWLKQGNLSIAF